MTMQQPSQPPTSSEPVEHVAIVEHGRYNFRAAAVVGLIVGLHVYPPTAWFAVFELGVPAAIVGALLGLASGLSVRGIRHLYGS